MVLWGWWVGVGRSMVCPSRVWGWWVEVGQWRCVLLGLGLVGWGWSVVVWVGGLRGSVGGVLLLWFGVGAFGVGRSWFVLAGMVMGGLR